MNHPAIVIPFLILMVALAISQSAQRIVLELLYRIGQVLVAAIAVMTGVGLYAPHLLPSWVRDQLVQRGMATEQQIADPQFWFSQGVLALAVGILVIQLLSYVRDLARVNRHLDDMERLLETVSSQIPSSKTQSVQGSMTKALETMSHFLKR